jgi:hypothetical protein
MGHALRSALDTNAESVLVRIDFKNAFNSVSRAALIEAVARHHPQLVPLVSWIYGQRSNLWVEGAPLDMASAIIPIILRHHQYYPIPCRISFQGSKCAEMGTTQSEKHMGIWGGCGRWGRKASDEM